MGFGTTTSVAIQDFILSILIVISDIVFKWVPAALFAITGNRLNIDTGVFLGGDSSASGSTVSGTESVSTSGRLGSTEVSLDATKHDSSGSTEVLANGDTSGVIELGVQQGGSSFSESTGVSFITDTFQTAWGIFAPLSIFVSLLLAMILVYAMIRMFQIRFAESKALEDAAVEESVPSVESSSTPSVGGVPLPTDNSPSLNQKRWNRIESQVASEEENDWRLAILEADIMLGEMLEEKGFIGDTIGEKLKTATRGDFKTLDLAWDAHRMRNHIAHRGSSHDLNHREAKRVISEFGQVFKEFKII